MIAPNSILQNRYHVVRELGRGGMGAVYEAVDQRFGSRVAVKQTLVADPTLRRAFAREAQLLNSLRHRALPVVTDFFDEGDGQFLVMQYIKGEDLGHMLARNGRPFDVDTVLRWADDLLDALDYLHSRTPPIVHRDIKPQNLKLTPEGEIVLLDFGLAKGSLDHMTRVATGSIQGYTPMYAPLEQMRGQGTDTRSDLYSLGATLHHLITGTPPADALARADAALQGYPDPLPRANEIDPRVPVAVSDALWRAMALRRDDRPSSARAMKLALGAYQPAKPVEAVPLPETVAAPPPRATPPTVPDPQPVRATPRTAVETPPKPLAPTVAQVSTGAGTSLGRKLALVGGIAFLVAGFGGAGYLVWLVASSEGDVPPTPPGVTIPTSKTSAGTSFTAPVDVFEVAANADGALVATVGGDSSVRLWRSDDGKEARVLAGHSKPGRCVAFGPDGAVASGSDDGKVRVWSKDGAPLITLDGHSGGTFSVAFASDGASLASAGYDGVVRFWNLLGGPRFGDARAPSRDDLVVCVNADRGLVAFLDRKAGVVKIWSAAEKRMVRELRLPTPEVTCGVFSPPGNLLALGSSDGRVRLWEVDTGRLAGEASAGGPEIAAVTVGSGGAIASGTADGRVQTWVLSNAGLVRGATLEGHGKVVVSLAFSRDGRMLASAAEDRTVRTWRIAQ